MTKTQQRYKMHFQLPNHLVANKVYSIIFLPWWIFWNLQLEDKPSKIVEFIKPHYISGAKYLPRNWCYKEVIHRDKKHVRESSIILNNLRQYMVNSA